MITAPGLFFLTKDSWNQPINKGMSIENHFTDISTALFDRGPEASLADRGLGLYQSALRDRHIELRKRLARHGSETLRDADLLELVLLRSAPRTDTRRTASDLLEHFGNFAGVISANTARLEEIVDHVSACDLKLIDAAAKRLAQGRLQNRPLISSWDALIEYCRAALAHHTSEEFRVLFLDRKNALIADEVLGSGTVDHVPVYPREVLKRALELNACALILIHNHPSGDPTPSDFDIAMTRLIHSAADSLSITLHDHIIVGATSEVSFVSEGLL